MRIKRNPLAHSNPVTLSRAGRSSPRDEVTVADGNCSPILHAKFRGLDDN